ncbi:MAG TPA: hypothetical protein VEJ84_21300 [Acidimicrobiales bacterium]|nr:hypothetical protein [Acidimicrobiales bacterium]
MARGKYEARKLGTAPPPVANGGVGPSTEVSSSTSPRAGGQAGTPALGIVVMSPWGWRILAMATLTALGICITFFLDGHTAYGGLWVFVVAGWGAFSYKLWRMHLAWAAL